MGGVEFLHTATIKYQIFPCSFWRNLTLDFTVQQEDFHLPFLHIQPS